MIAQKRDHVDRILGGEEKSNARGKITEDYGRRCKVIANVILLSLASRN